jgi:hypothetical protein
MDRECPATTSALGKDHITPITVHKFVTIPSPIPPKPTGIALQYFLYRYCTKCDHHRKGLKVNEGVDRRNHRKPVSSPEVQG